MATMSGGEYLAWEREQSERHEYRRGLADKAAHRDFRREGEGWHYETAEAGERLTLAGQFELEVDAIYERIFELPED